MGTINVDNIKGADGGAVTSLDVEKIDTPGDLTIDVDGGTISIQDGGTEVGKIDNSNLKQIMVSSIILL